MLRYDENIFKVWALGKEEIASGIKASQKKATITDLKNNKKLCNVPLFKKTITSYGSF